ncbi:MAG: protein kinase [Verrucomicrobiales bacterium]|nr:protein kinase [Verrucomicrobiales bacterium]
MDRQTANARELQERERALFALALEKAPERRGAFLEAMCEGNGALRGRLEALLAAHDQPEPELCGPDEGTFATQSCDLQGPPDEAVGQTLGRYKLLEKLGEGGCGVVYVAEQTEPVRRRVALKVIKLGMDTKQVVARFEAERQALAMMDHPNIARVLDAGTTGGSHPASGHPLPSLDEGRGAGSEGLSQLPQGRPYFVMELVRGIRITDYCDQSNLSTKDRLELFIKVCQAIQHAHQKAIIHRDIKPSNILVTLHDGVPVPKVIDFGIAKATEGKLADATVYTQLHQFIGTPAYMSPEQAEMSGLDIDTRSDIYSLGVLLYELLAGSTPLDGKELMASGIDTMRRTIREKEPPRPSTRLATLGADKLTTTAKRRSVEPPRLIQQVEGDLDWIVMKCLEKDRQRRYETANGLAADLRRHLDNEPVTARPPSAAYKFQKAIRRNRLVFAAGGAVALALIVGISVSAWQAVRATRAGEQARARQLEAEAERHRADEQTRIAVENREHSRRLLYAADMKQAQQSVNESNLGRARRLLDRHRPAPGEEDLRGWEWRYLWQLCRGEAFAVLDNGSRSSSLSVRFSPDGARLAVGYTGGEIELWDTAHQIRVKQFQPNGGMAKAVFSPRPNLLATATGLGNITLHDLVRGSETVLWQGSNAVRELSFTPDGLGLATFTYNQGSPIAEAVTFDMTKGVVSGTHLTSGTGRWVGTVRLSSDRKRLFLSQAAGAASQLSAKCLNPETGRELWTADLGTNDGVSMMALSPDDRFLVLATAYEQTPLRVLDAETGKLVARLEGHTGWVAEGAFSRDGRWFASGAADQTVRVWETTGWTNVRVLQGHGDEIWSIDVSPDGTMLASGSRDGSVLLWALSARPSPYGFRLLPPEVLFAAEFAPGKVHAEVSGAGGLGFVALKLEDLSQSGAPIPFDNNSTRVLRLPNIYAEYNRTNELRVWEGREAVSEVFVTSAGSNVVLWEGKPRPAFAYARGDRQIAWGETPDTVHIASLDDPSRRWAWKSELHPPAPRLFSPDGRLVYIEALPPDRGFEVREVATGMLVLRSDLPADRPKPYFADSGRKLVMAILKQDDSEVVFWDLSHPDQAPVILPERGAIRPMSISPDGRWVAAPSEYGIAVVYDVSTMKRIRTLQGTRHGVHGVTFSPDSRSVATGSGGQEAVQLWQLETGQELLTLPGKGTGFDTIAFAEDGNTLLVGVLGKPGTWQMWRAPSWEVIQAAEAKRPATKP